MNFLKMLHNNKTSELDNLELLNNLSFVVVCSFLLASNKTSRLNSIGTLSVMPIGIGIPRTSGIIYGFNQPTKGFRPGLY